MTFLKLCFCMPIFCKLKHSSPEGRKYMDFTSLQERKKIYKYPKQVPQTPETQKITRSLPIKAAGIFWRDLKEAGLHSMQVPLSYLSSLIISLSWITTLDWCNGFLSLPLGNRYLFSSCQEWSHNNHISTPI